MSRRKATRRGRAGQAYHALEVVENSLCIQQPNSIARHQTTKGVSNNAQLGDLASLLLNGAQFLLDLGANPLAAALDAIVGKTSAVSLRKKQI